MAKIKHIAIATQNEDETAKFYVDAFGLTQVGKINLPAVSGYFLTDGSINLAILHFKNDQVAGVNAAKNGLVFITLAFRLRVWKRLPRRLLQQVAAPVKTLIRPSILLRVLPGTAMRKFGTGDQMVSRLTYLGRDG